MPDGFPCPNPICPHTFSPDAVKGAASLKCPRCGTVYQFRQDRPGKPKSGPVPRAAPPPPPPPPPVARPVAPIAPVAPVAGPPGRAPNPALKLESTADMVLAPRPRRPARRGWLKLVIGLVVFIVLAGGAAGGVYWLVRSLPGDEENSPEATRAAGNFTFTIPRGWRSDEDAKLALHVHVALRKSKPRSHAALLFRDFKERDASHAELLDVALTRLRGYFKTDPEYEDPFEDRSKGPTGTLGGEPAFVLRFQAVGKDEVEMAGHVYMLARRGYAYWFFTWGPADDEDQLAAHWEVVRSRFKLANRREGWKPHPPPSDSFASPDLGVRIDYVRRLWRKENPKDYDDRALLVLRGFEAREDEETGKKTVVVHAGNAATVQVLVLKDEKDVKAAYEAALNHIKKKEMDLYPALKIDPVNGKTGKPLGGVEVGALRGQWGKLEIKLDEGTSRFGILAVVNMPGKGLLAILCQCPWERRTFWDQEFRAVLETVRPGRKS